MLLLATTTTPQPMPEVLAQMLLVIGVVGIGVLLTVSIRRKIAKKNAATPEPRQRIAQAKSVRRLAEDKHAVSSELHDTAQRLAAALDNKAERLEQLIMEAEGRITELQGLVDSTVSQVRVDPFPQAETEAISHEIERHLPPGTTPGTIPESAPDPQVMAPVAEPPRNLDPLTCSVYELSDAGHNSVSIAQVLDEQIGKVELILALREN